MATALAAKDRAKAEQDAKHAQQEVNRYKAIQKAITAALKKAGMAGTALFTIDERGLVVTIVTNTLVFGGNSAELLAGGRHILDQVVPPLLAIANSIEVDGHTNQQNVSTYPVPERLGTLLGPGECSRALPGRRLQLPAEPAARCWVLRPEAPVFAE